MATITNDYNHCQLFNTASAANGRGPFFIRQIGSSPGSTTISSDPYLLRKDGVWVLTLRAFALSEAEQQQFFYPSAADVMQVLDSLEGSPVFEDQIPEGMTRQELLLKAEGTLSRLMSAMKNAKPCAMPS